MLRITRFRASLFATAVMATPALAQDAGSMVDQLLPAAAKPAAAVADAPVFSVQSATKDEMVGRLGAEVLTRSIDPKTAKARSIVLGEGHEAEDLAALRPMPSMQVAVAFQGSSDALAPEAGALLGTLAEALNDPKLASYRFVIGVHTNSVGSDAYNLSLSSLRAKAIVDQLVAVHGLSKKRLYALGFGRISDGASGGEPSERIRVVNLGSATVVPAGAAAPALTAVTPGPAIKTRPHVVHARKAVPHVAHRRAPVPYADAVETRPRTRVHAPRTAEFTRPHPHGRGHANDAQGFAGYGSAYGSPAGYSTNYSGPASYGSGYAASAGWGGGGDPSGGRSNGTSGSGSGGSSSGGGGGSASSGGGSSGGSGSSGGGGGHTGGGGGWSDRRLKRDIRRLGLSPSGLTVYSFRYVWGGPVMVGVMAQDLLLTRPEAVIVGPGGYMQVDYDKIDVKMMTLDAWLKAKAAV